MKNRTLEEKATIEYNSYSSKTKVMEFKLTATT